MADRICWNCGAKNAPDARFCTNCQSYLGWDTGSGDSGGDSGGGAGDEAKTATGSDTRPGGEAAGAGVGSGSTATEGVPDVHVGGDDRSGDAGGDDDAGGSAGEAAAIGTAPAPGSPDVTVATPEVTLRPDGPARVELAIENPTKVVDGYDVEMVDPPDWLELVGPEVHLMPGASDDVELSLVMRPGPMVVAQRAELTLRISSQEDARRYAVADLVVHVPAYGPRVGITASPALIRLEDAGDGSFTLTLDNRSANHPQRLTLAGKDPEDVVDFRFSTSTIEVGPGSTADVRVEFSAPQPPPGQQRNRQLAVAATDDEGPIPATITLVQSTAAAPVDAPITLRIQPSTIRLDDAQDAEFDVLVDNRGGHSGVTVALTGVDPEQRLSFAFIPARFVAAPGKVTKARGLVRAEPPPPGSQATHPFTVVATDGASDASGDAMLEMTSSAAAIATAELRANPERLDLGHHRQGQFTVEIDNRRGVRPLNVAISGRSDDGAVRAMFAPASVVVAPGAIGYSRVSLTSPHPPSGQQATRRLHVTASDGSQDLETSVEIAQVRPNRRPTVGRWLIALGAALVIVGALLLPWFIDLPRPELNPIAIAQDILTSTGLQSEFVEGPLRILLVVLAVLMLFGIAGKDGGLSRKTAVLIVLLAAGYLVFLAATPEMTLSALDIGLPFVWIGAALAYAGGILVRMKD
ncbi:zinc ribbon domain-containing protein [Agromyces kandeliae]|uniref:Zinc-ribbon domain-containing protein n=1 Tax=Agromyces kandeliae TaxID=2666141 RepID=A0A6L5QZP7_9MICO|nr:zinc ribbon domain-containing protein [Agromyces kandeliae]MRX43252.1 hypothetical protein [Agromyces kandeliae]